MQKQPDHRESLREQVALYLGGLITRPALSEHSESKGLSREFKEKHLDIIVYQANHGRLGHQRTITAHNAILDAALVQARRVSADHVAAALVDVL